jgi:hypothetical protein
MTISSNSSGSRPGVCTSTTRPTTPYEGMMIYETDTNRVLVWDNAAWVMIAETDQPPGLQLIKSQSVGSGVSSVPVTNVFSSEFTNYLINWDNGTTSGSSNMGIRLGSTVTGYYSALIQVTVGTNAIASGARNGTETYFDWAGYSTTSNNYFSVFLYNPNIAKHTFMKSSLFNPSGSITLGEVTGILGNTIQYTDFTILPTGAGITMTGGTITVYGYRV